MVHKVCFFEAWYVALGIYINYDPGLTLVYFTTRSNLVSDALTWTNTDSKSFNWKNPTVNDLSDRRFVSVWIFLFQGLIQGFIRYMTVILNLSSFLVPFSKSKPNSTRNIKGYEGWKIARIIRTRWPSRPYEMIPHSFKGSTEALAHHSDDEQRLTVTYNSINRQCQFINLTPFCTPFYRENVCR